MKRYKDSLKASFMDFIILLVLGTDCTLKIMLSGIALAQREQATKKPRESPKAEQKQKSAKPDPRAHHFKLTCCISSRPFNQASKNTPTHMICEQMVKINREPAHEIMVLIA